MAEKRAVVLEYGRPVATGPRLRWPALSRVLLEVLWMFLGFAVLFERDEERMKIFGGFSLVVVGASLCLLGTRLFLVPPSDARDRKRWRWVMIGAVILLVLNVRYEACPHARHLWVGPYYWVFGDRCGNGRWPRNIVQMAVHWVIDGNTRP